MRKRRACSGSQMIHLVGLIFISLMISALAIDFGYYFAAQNKLQTAADAAALASAMQLYQSNGRGAYQKLREATEAAKEFVNENEPGLKLDIDDVAFGYIDPLSKRYDPIQFAGYAPGSNYATTDGYNAVRVKLFRAKNSVNAPLRTFMGNLFGVSTMDTAAYSVAFLDKNITAITDGGLRPIYACSAQVQQALKDGNLENNRIRVYADHLEVDGKWDINDCPPRDSAHWGFSDFTGGKADIRTIENWLTRGYNGSVQVGQRYNTQANNVLEEIAPALDTLIQKETVFPIPVYTQWKGSGSKAHVIVSGFVGFRLTGYKIGRYQYLEGHFARYLCKQGCTADNRIAVSDNSHAVKIRLAAQS